MLNRKPRVGERLIFQEPRGDPVELVVKRFHETYPSIMLVFTLSGETDLYIWRFRDGLNDYLHHAEDKPNERKERQRQDRAHGTYGTR
jgi:hypothetical protein